MTMSLKKAGVMDMVKELIDSKHDGEFHGDQLLIAERVATGQ